MVVRLGFCQVASQPSVVRTKALSVRFATRHNELVPRNSALTINPADYVAVRRSP